MILSRYGDYGQTASYFTFKKLGTVNMLFPVDVGPNMPSGLALCRTTLQLSRFFIDFIDLIHIIDIGA